MQFPSLADLDHLDIPRGEDREPQRVERDGRVFAISGSWGGWIRTHLDDAHDLVLSLDCRREYRRRFLVYRDVRWVQVDVQIFPKGEEFRGIRLASGLKDTAELTGDLAGIRPLVEACLAAFVAELPAFRAAMAQRAAAKQAADDARAAERRATADRLLELFRGEQAPDLAVAARDPRIRHSTHLIRTDSVDVRIPVAGRDYTVHAWTQDNGDGDASIWLSTGWGTPDAAMSTAALSIVTPGMKGRGPKVAEGRLMVAWTPEIVFRHTTEIADPRARVLAARMLAAIAEHDRRVIAAIAAEEAEKARRELALREAVSGRSSGQVTADTLVRVPFSDRLRTVRFRHLSDGTWASDAIIAVQRGKEGEKVYAEAIHLPRAGSLPREVVLGPGHLRALRDQSPRIIGWVATGGADAGPGPSFAVTADPSLCDADYVRDPGAPPPSVAPAGGR